MYEVYKFMYALLRSVEDTRDEIHVQVQYRTVPTLCFDVLRNRSRMDDAVLYCTVLPTYCTSDKALGMHSVPNLNVPFCRCGRSDTKGMQHY